MRAPDFWQRDGFLPRLLSPLGRAYAWLGARRIARPGWSAPVPVVCVGNATVGGTGKTPVALDIAKRLIARGEAPHFLTRGYRGSAKGVRLVDPFGHDSATVGDEALLLSATAPTWVGADRAAAARAAIAHGATVLVMDDGLQNPGLAKTLSFMVIDGGSGFGNGCVLPAGPLRETVGACAARVQAAIIIGADSAGIEFTLPKTLPVLRANIVPEPELMKLRGKSILAFAGIGRPEKFFAMLRHAGLDVVAEHPFPDHHPFSRTDLLRLTRSDAISVCTQKDYVRILTDFRANFTPIGMSLAWQSPDKLGHFLEQALR